MERSCCIELLKFLAVPKDLEPLGFRVIGAHSPDDRFLEPEANVVEGSQHNILFRALITLHHSVGTPVTGEAGT